MYQVMGILALTLTLAVSSFAVESFRARVIVEEGESETCYLVDFKPGALRIEPELEDVYLLVDVDLHTVTLVHSRERFYCRLEPKGHRRLMKSGTISPSWWPWLYGVAPDLVENLSLESAGQFRLPDGRQGLQFLVRSENYNRVVARYWLDPELPREVFFQWRGVYLLLWGEGEEQADDAQQKRLDLYDRLPGVPLKMEERFALLSRPRTVRLEEQQPIPAGAFSIPEDFAEKKVTELYWDSLIRRLLGWFLWQETDRDPKEP